MRRAILVIMGSLLAVAALACAIESSSSPVEGTLRIPNGMGFGGSDDGIVVQFVEVTGDSRCPANVQCVRAGEAYVKLVVTVDSGPAQESVVEIASQVQPTFNVDRFTITLLELQPDPPPVGGVAQGQYELKLRIEEN